MVGHHARLVRTAGDDRHRANAAVSAIVVAHG
jgi:hypothetical protein